MSRSWESRLDAGDRVIASWNCVVSKLRHCFSSPATVVAVQPLWIDVIPDSNDGDQNIGRRISCPRYLNPRRTAYANVTRRARLEHLGPCPTAIKIFSVWHGMDAGNRALAMWAWTVSKKLIVQGGPNVSMNFDYLRNVHAALDLPSLSRANEAAFHLGSRHLHQILNDAGEIIDPRIKRRKLST